MFSTSYNEFFKKRAAKVTEPKKKAVIKPRKKEEPVVKQTVSQKKIKTPINDAIFTDGKGRERLDNNYENATVALIKDCKPFIMGIRQLSKNGSSKTQFYVKINNDGISFSLDKVTNTIQYASIFAPYADLLYLRLDKDNEKFCPVDKYYTFTIDSLKALNSLIPETDTSKGSSKEDHVLQIVISQRPDKEEGVVSIISFSTITTRDIEEIVSDESDEPRSYMSTPGSVLSYRITPLTENKDNVLQRKYFEMLLPQIKSCWPIELDLENEVEKQKFSNFISFIDNGAKKGDPMFSLKIATDSSLTHSNRLEFAVKQMPNSTNNNGTESAVHTNFFTTVDEIEDFYFFDTDKDDDEGFQNVTMPYDLCKFNKSKPVIKFHIDKEKTCKISFFRATHIISFIIRNNDQQGYRQSLTPANIS